MPMFGVAWAKDGGVDHIMVLAPEEKMLAEVRAPPALTAGLVVRQRQSLRRPAIASQRGRQTQGGIAQHAGVAAGDGIAVVALNKS